MRQGGSFITENLKAIVETGKPAGQGRFALFMMGLFAVFTPKRCRSENWHSEAHRPWLIMVSFYGAGFFRGES